MPNTFEPITIYSLAKLERPFRHGERILPVRGVSPPALGLSEQREIDGGRHRRIGGIGTVEMVAWMIAIADLRWIGRIADRLVKVQHAIDLPISANPRIYRLTNCLALLRIVGSAPVGRDGCGQHPE